MSFPRFKHGHYSESNTLDRDCLKTGDFFSFNFVHIISAGGDFYHFRNEFLIRMTPDLNMILGSTGMKAGKRAEADGVERGQMLFQPKPWHARGLRASNHSPSYP